MNRWGPALGAVAALAALAGCGPAGFWSEHFRDSLAGEKAVTRRLSGPRELAMFDGSGRLALDWADLLEAVRLADVVVVGERHSDATGHAVELALAADALRLWKGTALSMEMLTRANQAAVDGYLAGKLTEDEFIQQAGVADWAGKGTWAKWYQPLLDAAKAAGARVVAADAPREYVDLARTGGYTALRRLPEAERGLFDIPAGDTRGAYYRRFRDEMRDHAPPPTPEEKPKPEAAKEPPHAMASREVAAMFRAQQVWDATMAASILKAKEGGADRVIHFVGGFHSDFDGGLVRRLRRGAPGLRVLTISLVPVHTHRLRPEDRARADIVAYTEVFEEGTAPLAAP